MRRRRKAGNASGTKKGKTKKEKGAVDIGEEVVTVSDKEAEMSLTAMDVVDSTNHHYFGHGHHHFHNTTSRQTPELEVVPPVQNHKAVGARKRKPTQISKIVDKPSSEVESVDDNGINKEPLSPPYNNNNNSPPHKKAYIQSGEKNGMIQNIVTELKSAKKASSKLDSPGSIPKHASLSTIEGDFSSDGEDSLQIEIEEEEENLERQKANKGREDKVDLANIRTLLSSSLKSEDEDGIDMRKEGSEGEDGDYEQLPFRCGVCPFGTVDRAALLRHMKTHSGERSFQCRLCCFAFTTKANCERHLRNRHGQIEKDQIRNLVVVFSSSSSNNSESETETTSLSQRKSPSSSSIPINKNATSGGLLLQHKERHHSGNAALNLIGGRFNLAGTVHPLSTVTQDEEQPLDLSMDAVDLSTKSRVVSAGSLRASLLRPRPIYPTAEIPNLLVTSPFVTKREPMTHPQLSLQMLGDEQYNGLFHGYSPFTNNSIRNPDLSGSSTPAAPQPFALFPFGGTPTYNPFSFPTPAMEKVGPGHSSNLANLPTSKATQPFMAPSPPASFESRESLEKELKTKSLKKELKAQIPESSSTSSVSPTTSRKRADSKNGEYQKPKQRRYRTERPFSCPHCPARFTLRSNMERHGKHQHPNVWQRSPSNRVINRQQKSQQSPLAGPPTMVHSSNVTSPSGMEVKSKNRNPAVNGDIVSNVDVRAVIAQQLKRKISNSALVNGTGAESETDSEANGAESGRGNDSSDLASVSQLLDRVKNSNIAQYFHEQTTKSLTNSEDNDNEDDMSGTESQSGSSDDGDDGEVDETEEVNDNGEQVKGEKKKSAYSSAPHKISCPHCTRRFPWTSSLRRHLLTHTGQKPYQCSQCPLLFTTKSNCDRHLARKHSGKGKCTGSGYNTTEDDEEEGEEEGRIPEEDGESGAEVGEETEEVNDPVSTSTQQTPVAQKNVVNSTTSSPGEDVSFRCHLCEAAASERDVLLAHMEEDHKETFHLLISKGALTSSPPSENSEAEPLNQIPGDPKETTHRKVICVFCVRRFWSVEDLRRHIRSHSGERPFSCTHCSRRFTLKHSMLRHLKKHVGEDAQAPTPPLRREKASKKSKNSGSILKSTEEQGDQTNLISRLLGIHDEGLVEQLLSKPDAKDAAKLLGLRVGLAKQTASLTSSN